jgi:hypothetical protein
MLLASKILKSQYPGFDGLFDTVNHVPRPDKNNPGYWLQRHPFPKAKGNAVQLHFNGTNHWVMSCRVDGKVFLLDSMQSKSIEPSIEMQLVSMYGTPGTELRINVANAMRQLDNSSCGVHAILNAQYVLQNGECLLGRQFRQVMNMRGHLAQCLTDRKFTNFETRKVSTKVLSSELTVVTISKSACECGQSDLLAKMLQCSTCEKWLHFPCAGFADCGYDDVQLPHKWDCSQCLATL